MPRRPPPTPLMLAKGPIPPRGTPRHQLPEIPRAALIVADSAPHYHRSHSATSTVTSRERTLSNTSNTSFSSIGSTSSSNTYPLRARAASDLTMGMLSMTSSWAALDVSRREVLLPPPVMLATQTSSSSKRARVTIYGGGGLASRRVSF